VVEEVELHPHDADIPAHPEEVASGLPAPEVATVVPEPDPDVVRLRVLDEAAELAVAPPPPEAFNNIA
jgi:hypothetical protein